MNSATATRTLDINGMSGDTCVQKVTGALKGVHGVTTQSVKVGSATISADKVGCDAACSAIDKAGYKAHEASGSNGSNGSNGADGAKPMQDKTNHVSSTEVKPAPGSANNPAATPITAKQ